MKLFVFVVLLSYNFAAQKDETLINYLKYMHA